MKKKVLPVIFIIAIIILIGIIYVGQQFVQKFSYSNDIADFSSYFGVTSSEDIPIVLGTEKLEVFARNTDGVYYMDFNNVQTYLNDRFYCGTEDGILVYTTPTEIISSVIGTNSYTVNGADEQSLEYTISYYDGDILYVALPYVQKYTDFTFEGFDSPSYVYIVNAWNEQTQATVNKDTKLRIKGGVKSEILESVEAEETVIVLEEMETWTKVETARGLIGYIENKRLDNIQTVTPTHEAVYVEPEYTSLTRDYKINMGFNAIGGEGGNDSMESLVASTKSLNVISPTWYALSDNLGNIRSYASSDYVTKAHALGLEVWALVDNFTGPEGVSTQEILSHASSRQTLITNLIDQAGTYGFDGINIDFESIDSSYAQSYIEFIREISIACRANGLVLSIDNYVPMNFNDFYDLEEQGTVADYVVIMGYDEHYAGSEEAGSVASIGYVENGIKDTVEVVDPSKVINAIPFYTRIWKTQGGSVSSQAVVMDTANEYIATHGIEMKWDDTTCQNYGEFTDSDGSFVQIWLEDAQSISAKLSVMSTYNIAGVAEWELGFETADVWDEIEAYIGG